MVASHVFGALLYISGALAYGTILSPAHRSNVGSAAQAACGNELAAYIAAHPGADLGDVQAHEGLGYDATACNVQRCSGYQYGDNLANTHTITTSQTFNVTVNYTVPSAPPPGSGDYYELYVPSFALVNKTSGYDIYGSQYSAAPNSPQELVYPSVKTINGWGFGDIVPAGACSKPGQCYFSFQLVNFFRSPTLVSQRILDSSCIDVVIKWT